MLIISCLHFLMFKWKKNGIITRRVFCNVWTFPASIRLGFRINREEKLNKNEKIKFNFLNLLRMIDKFWLWKGYELANKLRVINQNQWLIIGIFQKFPWKKSRFVITDFHLFTMITSITITKFYWSIIIYLSSNNLTI